MKHHSNPQCSECAMGHNAINGRYCRTLKHYVEYADKSPCNRITKTT